MKAATVAIPKLFAMSMLTVASAYSMTADAENVRRHSVTATGVCHPVTSAAIPAIRHRPLGIINESTLGTIPQGDAIYISCSLPVDTYTDNRTAAGSTGMEFQLDATNTNFSATELPCSLEVGSRREGLNTYPMTINLPARTNVRTTLSNLDRKSSSGSMNISCLLEPGVEIGSLHLKEFDAAGAL